MKLVPVNEPGFKVYVLAPVGVNVTVILEQIIFEEADKLTVTALAG